MQLYTYFRSSASFRVRIALNLKGLAYESVPVDLRAGAQKAPDYMARNPQGMVPALGIDGATLGQSLAIIEYLDETHPAPPLLPTEPLARAQVRAMALEIACDIHPLNNLRVLKYLKGPLGHDQPSVDAWYRHWIEEGFVALEQAVAKHGSDGHCFGNSVTLADVCLAPQMWNARRFNADLTSFPNLTRVDAYLQTLEAFRLAAPEAQPDWT